MGVLYATVRWIVPATALVCLLGAPVLAVDGVLEINENCVRRELGCFPGDAGGTPVTITRSGSYILTSNIVVHDADLDAIQILVNDVTLDLNGHTIQGPNTGGGIGSGIYALNRYNLTIRNGRIWGFGHFGIGLVASGGHPSSKRAGYRIEAMHVANNEDGVWLDGGLILDSTVDGNRDFGISASAAAVRNVTANKNGASGFELNLSTAMNCVAVGNGAHGFALTRSSLSGCVAIENGNVGVHVRYSSVTGCRAHENGDHGISMGLGTLNGFNHVFRNSASENKGAVQIFCPNNGTDNVCVDNASF